MSGRGPTKDIVPSLLSTRSRICFRELKCELTIPRIVPADHIQLKKPFDRGAAGHHGSGMVRGLGGLGFLLDRCHTRGRRAVCSWDGRGQTACSVLYGATHDSVAGWRSHSSHARHCRIRVRIRDIQLEILQATSDQKKEIVPPSNWPGDLHWSGANWTVRLCNGCGTSKRWRKEEGRRRRAKSMEMKRGEERREEKGRGRSPSRQLASLLTSGCACLPGPYQRACACCAIGDEYIAEGIIQARTLIPGVQFIASENP